MVRVKIDLYSLVLMRRLRSSLFLFQQKLKFNSIYIITLFKILNNMSPYTLLNTLK
jgi:hypothetical protein